MSWFARVGLAIVRPRWALASAADRRNAGRSGSDLIVLIAVLIVATQLRGIVGAVWLGIVVDGMLGLRGVTQILTRALTVDLAFLVLGAFVLFAGAGPKRNLGRAFDLACVAAIPLIVVELCATAIVRGVGVTDSSVPMSVGWVLAAISWGWAGALLALAWRPARSAATPPEPPAEVVRPAKYTGLALALLAAAGIVFQVGWLARNLDSLRPVSVGNAAPAFALRAIGPTGTLGEPRGITPGKITVIDFWATWCKPCIVALPKLEAMQSPDVEVLTINLDDPKAARELFDQQRYTMPLLADDGGTSERYGVSSIPHTVVIGRDGMVVRVFRGSTKDLATTVEQIRK